MKAIKRVNGHDYVIRCREKRNLGCRLQCPKCEKWTKRRIRFVYIVVVFLVVAQPFVWSPYAISYANPLLSDVRPLTQQGWGEGLDEAARWLNARSTIEKLSVATWYPSVMRYYFNGKAMSLSSRDDHRVGYVVTYRNMGGRAGDEIASNVIDEFRGIVPEHVIEIGGRPYVWIYNTLGPYYFRDHVGELMSGMEVGQTVSIGMDGWQRIDFALSSFDNENSNGTITLHVRENVDATEDIRDVSVSASDIDNEGWQSFVFDPILDSIDREYYVALTSDINDFSNAVTVRYSKDDVKQGSAVIRRKPLIEGARNSEYIRAGDLGYIIRNKL